MKQIKSEGMPQFSLVPGSAEIMPGKIYTKNLMELEPPGTTVYKGLVAPCLELELDKAPDILLHGFFSFSIFIPFTGKEKPDT
jgi:hypothetical protein